VVEEVVTKVGGVVVVVEGHDADVTKDLSMVEDKLEEKKEIAIAVTVGLEVRDVVGVERRWTRWCCWCRTCLRKNVSSSKVWARRK